MSCTCRQSRVAFHQLGFGLLLGALMLGAPRSLHAQAPAPAASEGVSLTLEGCLTMEGRRGTSSAAEQFVLTVAATPGAQAGQRGAAAASGASVPAPPQPTMYTLRSADDTPVELPSFVGHRVRVTGTSTGPMTTAPLAGRSPEATPYQAPVASPTETGATGTPFDSTNLPTLVVSTIASLASTCR